MDSFINLNSQTSGKDKLARLFQYFCRVLWYHIQKRKFDPYTADKLKSLEYTLSTFRKLLRLGKSIEVFYSALKSIHYQDVTVKLTCTMSKISTAIFLLTDHILWIGRSGLGSVDTNKSSQISNKYWLFSVMLNLVRDFYEIIRIFEKKSMRLRMERGAEVRMLSKQCLKFGENFINEHKDIFWDTIKNGCDIWIPLNSLGYVKFNPGVIGFLGTISSIAGLVCLLNPQARLSPS